MRSTAKPRVRVSLAATGLLGAVLLGATPALAQHGAAGGEWRSYAGEGGGTKYSPLDQVHAGNVQDLHIAWRWRSVDHELADADPDLQFNPLLLTTPLMVGGRLLMSPNLGQATAIDPATGETTWVYRAVEDGAGRPRGGATRGVGYWHDPERDDERVFVVSGEQLVALDARTGDPLREFGTGGKVDLTAGVPHLEEYRWTAAPLTCRDTVIVGIFTSDQFDRPDQARG